MQQLNLDDRCTFCLYLNNSDNIILLIDLKQSKFVLFCCSSREGHYFILPYTSFRYFFLLCVLQMIANSLLSLAFLWAWKKGQVRLKELRTVRKKIAEAAIDSVAEAVKKMQSVGEGQKVFLIIKGLLKLRVKLRGEKSIYSLMELSQIKQGKLGEHFLKKTWEDLADRAYWKQPHNPKNLQFEMQDMTRPDQKIIVKGCEQANLSGALNELYKDHNVRKSSSSMVVRVAIRIYNFLVSKFPFSLILSPTEIGEELTLYGIQDGQYSLVIGEFQKDKTTQELLCRFPNYVTKQRSYVEIKIWKQEKRLMLITFLLASLLVITGIKFIRKLYEYFKQWRMRQIANDQNDDRSQNQGESCNCIVCYENVRNIIFKPCLHYAVCKTCFKMLSKTSCPYCKENIQDTIEVIKKK